MPPPPSTPFPTKEQVLDFINQSPDKIGKREIARAFNIKSADRVKLKALLRELTEDGLVQKGRGKAVRGKGKPPPVAVLTVTAVDDHGDLMCQLADPETAANDLKITLFTRPGKRSKSAELGVGDRVLARLNELKSGHFEAKPIKKLAARALQFVGVVRKPKGAGRATVISIERKSRKSFPLDAENLADINDGDIIVAESTGGPRYAPDRVKVTEIIGNEHDSHSISLIAIHAHGLRDAFPDNVLKLANSVRPPKLRDDTDFTHLDVITIDPENARDFDDAVHAEPDPAQDNDGGWIVTVAIADVAHFVRTDSVLDIEAKERGNSTYFPDRVVPMLPERLSNDLCSLRPDEPRSSLGVRMRFSATGKKLDHKFFRGTIRSRARLTYAQAQAAIDGKPDAATKDILEPMLKPLWAAYRAVDVARKRRAPLDLDVPEYKIVLNDNGHVDKVAPYERYDAHKLIEEFMIQANVAAAETLEQNHLSFVYRVHEAPSADKVEALRDTLKSVGLDLAQQNLRPSLFNGLLRQSAGKEYEKMIHEMVLRTQMQAIYSTDNFGHFGLNLRRYAHFTSPIRRYADVIVHRALIRALHLGKDGLTDEELATLDQTAQHISFAERRSMAAERETVTRYIAAFLADRVGAIFQGKITGVSRFGLFVALSETGADGLVPMRSLTDDRYNVTDAQNALIGERTGGEYHLGQSVKVRLAQADTLTGAIQLDLLSDPVKGTSKPAGSRQRKPGPRRSPSRQSKTKKSAAKRRPAR